MAGCCPFGLSCDTVVKSIASYLCGEKNNVLNLRKHVESLESALATITAVHEDLKRRVDQEEMKGLKPLAVVRLWFSNFKKIVPKVEDMLEKGEAEIKKLCISDYCSKEYISSYNYSADVCSLLESVKALLKRGDFTEVATSYVIKKVEGIAIDTSISQTEMVESTWKIFMGDSVWRLGLYGIPGAGKTTLLAQINNKFLNEGQEFDIVIWVVVPKDRKIQSMQEQIGRRLDIYNEEWIQKSEKEKAYDINRNLSKYKYVLLLDDLLVKVNLEDVGVPLRNRKIKSKIAFTTRHRKVCSYMSAGIIEVTRLDDEAAWVLFKKKVGEESEDMLRRNPEITRLARIICKECCGLPILINAIGHTMKSRKTVEEWRDATNSINSIITELSRLPNQETSSLDEFSFNIQSILKFSYNNLEDSKEKLCFRYYALFPENYEMRKEELIEYWECERLVAHTEGNRIFKILVDACLLMENEGKVKMHDMVRKMALSEEASDSNEPEGSVIVNTDPGLIQNPDDPSWSVVKWISLINNQIKEISGSPSSPKATSLTTLLLSNQWVENIPNDFFLKMPSLLVLDLSLNERLIHLPTNISKLGSLLYLNLSGTNIKLLPVGLKELKLLKNLNLERTLMLQNIVGLSALLSLRVLRLLGSASCYNPNFVEELQSLGNISVLTICFNTEAVLKSFSGCERLATHTQSLYIKDFPKEADGISIAETSSCLQTLEISNSTIKEIRIGMKSFEMLCEVKLIGCNGLKHLTWLLFAPKIVILNVEQAPDMEDILSEKEAEGMMRAKAEGMMRVEAEGMMRVKAALTPFTCLKSLVLKDLGQLRSIYWSPLPFEHLSKIFVQRCPNLKNLPLNSESAKNQKLVIDAEIDWKENLGWADDYTRDRFCRI